MSTISSNKTKFLQLGPVSSHDNTLKIESALQRKLLPHKKQNKISEPNYETIRPSGSYRPRLYGLPKFHLDRYYR